jgi:hypothetical protein
LYDALIGFCDAVGIVQCNYDIYLSEHEGGAANLVMLKRSISGFSTCFATSARVHNKVTCIMIRHDAFEYVIDRQCLAEYIVKVEYSELA